jgi:hypothetical protein
MIRHRTTPSSWSGTYLNNRRRYHACGYKLRFATRLGSRKLPLGLGCAPSKRLPHHSSQRPTTDPPLELGKHAVGKVQAVRQFMRIGSPTVNAARGDGIACSSR